MLVEALEIAEEKQLVPDDAAAQRPTPLVLGDRRQRNTGGVRKKVIRVELVVLQVIEQASVEAVTAALADYTDDAAAGSAKLRGHGVGNDLELFSGIGSQVRVRARRVAHLVIRHTVEQKRAGERLPAPDVDGPDPP